jgi:hypothetical protein
LLYALHARAARQRCGDCTRSRPSREPRLVRRAAGAAAAARPVVHASARHRRSSAGTHTPARAAAPRYFRPPTRCMRSEASPGAQNCSAEGACGCAGCDCRTAPAEPTYCAVPVLYRTRWQ